MESANSGHYGFLALNTCLLGGIIAYGKGLFLELLVCCSALGFFLSSLSLGCACSLPWNDNVKVMFSFQAKLPERGSFFLSRLLCSYVVFIYLMCSLSVCVKNSSLGRSWGFSLKNVSSGLTLSSFTDTI